MTRYADLLRRYFLPQWRSGVALLVLMLAATGAELVRPRLIASFIDGARSGVPLAALTRTAIVFIGLVVAGQAVRIADVYLAERVALIATNRLRADLTLHCLKLDLSFHHEHRPGELIQRIDGDVAHLTNFFSRLIVALLGNALLLVGVLVMLSTIDLRLGAGLAAFSVAVLTVVYRLRFTARAAWQRSMEAQADQAGFLEEHLSATEDIRSCGATAYVMRRFYEHARRVLRRRRRATVAGQAVGGLTMVLFTIGTASALLFAVWLFRRGQTTLGGVFLVFVYTETLSRPIGAINRQFQDMQTAGAAIVRVNELFAVRPEIADGPGARLARGPLGVALSGVSFAYVDAEPVLRDVEIRLEPGRVLGLLGRTGSGKTTITRLLLRFYDPDAGSVHVGDVDLRAPALAHLRERIGLVTQDVQLFHASLRDNLTFFDDAIPDERITRALSDVGLGDWLASLERGLDTPVASGLSAGQAQLVAFARVFVRDPGLVILDEATSRLDPATEQRVERAVSRLFEGRTAIVVAHRLRTVMRADDILVLDEGRVAEHGQRERLQADPDSRFSRLLRTGMEEVLA